jgi:ankyrin repeat protein
MVRRNKGGRTPLHEASSRRYSDIVLLLEHKADVGIRNSEYATTLHSTRFEGKLEATQLVLAHGRTSMRRTRRASPHSAMNGDEEVVRLLSQLVLGGGKKCNIYRSST